MALKTWSEATLSPLKVLLDAQNPRIEVSHDANQDEIRQKLLAHEKVATLASQIVKFGGLMPGERIIVCKDNNKHVVVEGNRRVCACQLLLNPNLIPEKFQKKIPRASQELKDTLKRIKADVAPDRDAAEPTITKRHTEPGIEMWRTTAKMRRASRLLDEGYDIEQIAEKLGATQSALRKAIKEYRLLRYVIDLEDSWKHEELERLTDQTLKTNAYTRFFTLAGVKEKLELSFDEHDHVTSTLLNDIFDQYMCHIARCFFIPPHGDRKPWANTRTTPDDIFNSFIQEESSQEQDGNQEYLTKQSQPLGSATTPSQKNSPAKLATGGKPKTNQSAPKSAKASIFFEKLVCTVDDDRLIALTKEITQIDHTSFPIAASMLLRALFESSLLYKVKKANKIKELNKKANGKDIGLQALISFCGNGQNQIFTHQRAADALASFEKAGMKDHLDFVVHGLWVEAEPAVVETAARILRPLITHIVQGNDHDMEENNA